MSDSERFGEDFLLDDKGLAVVAANGELSVSSGTRTALQDIMLRLKTPLGSLFYDEEFGSEIIYFVKDENNLSNRMALCAELEKRVTMDPRVVPLSAKGEIVTWNETGITARVSFNLIDESHSYNLIVTINNDMEMVISDVNPN